MSKKIASTKPSRAQRLRWQAEEVVRDAITNSPGYGAAVRKTMEELKRAEKVAQDALRGKGKK